MAATPPKRTKAINGPESIYDQEIADGILRRLAAGDYLKVICREGRAEHGDRFPHEATVRDWARQDRPAGFAAAFDRAKDIGVDCIAEDVMVQIDEATTVNEATIAKAKLDATRWYTEHMGKGRYSNRVIHAGDPTAPIRHTHDMTMLSDDDLAKLASEG